MCWPVESARFIMGGANQPLAHAQFVSNIVDYGMNLQEALEAPRFFKKTAGGCDVSIEDRIPLLTLQQLSERGHEISNASSVHDGDGTGPGYSSQFPDSNQLRSVGSAGGMVLLIRNR